VCGNNLRQVAVAVQVWSDSFEDLIPWQVAYQKGGTSFSPLIDNAWYNFSWISNELASPSVFSCPSDNARTATKWNSSADGGFLNPSYRGNALSYFLGCHAEIRRPSTILAGDRNIRPDSGPSACSLGFTAASMIQLQATQASWNPTNLHAGSGNILFITGAVQETTTPGLREVFHDRMNDNGSDHLLLPR
jgi:hypothetical protein